MEAEAGTETKAATNTETEKTVPDTDNTTSASEILAEMRSAAASETGGRSQNMGVTRDADGKSNVWAVEPTEKVDEKPEVNKAAVLGAVFAAVGAALIILPNLPLVNADQF